MWSACHRVTESAARPRCDSSSPAQTLTPPPPLLLRCLCWSTGKGSRATPGSPNPWAPARPWAGPPPDPAPSTPRTSTTLCSPRRCTPWPPPRAPTPHQHTPPRLRRSAPPTTRGRCCPGATTATTSGETGFGSGFGTGQGSGSSYGDICISRMVPTTVERLREGQGVRERLLRGIKGERGYKMADGSTEIESGEKNRHTSAPPSAGATDS